MSPPSPLYWNVTVKGPSIVRLEGRARKRRLVVVREVAVARRVPRKRRRGCASSVRAAERGKGSDDPAALHDFEDGAETGGAAIPRCAIEIAVVIEQAREGIGPVRASLK